MSVIYYAEDANPGVTDGKTVGILGYTHAGQQAAFNLRDSGISVIIGGSSTEQTTAHDHGFTATAIEQTVNRADILLITLPDELIAQIYMEAISPHLRRGHTLIFFSAYAVAFGFIEPPPFVDVCLIAPRSQHTLREHYLSGQGTLSFVAVWQDAGHQPWEHVLALALALGTLQAGAIEISFEQEAELRLFVQQTVLPVFHHTMTVAANLLMTEGYPTDALLADLYLSGKFTDYVRQVAGAGLMHALSQHNVMDQYAALSRFDRFNELKLERLMEITLEEIRSGQFAQEWTREYRDGHPRLAKLRRQHESNDLWELEQQTLEFLHPDDEN
jgi:ketol-acid reductoisomerase